MGKVFELRKWKRWRLSW